MTGATFLIDDNPVARARRFMAGMPYRIPAGDGTGYLAGEFPGGTTTVEGAPVAAEVRALWRGPAGHPADGAVCGSAQSGASGTWIITNLNENLRYDVVGRKEGFNDVIVANVTPTSMVDITYSGAVIENETFTGAEGYVEIVGGIPPYSVAAETPLPTGLFPVVSGRNLIIDGTTEDDEVATFEVKVTSSNGAEKIIPIQLVVGFKAPANFKAETVVVDDVFSVSLTWEVTNSTQQVKVYRSATPFDLDDLPEPIATLSGTSTTYTDDDVIEDDHFYYMVTAISEQYELRSEVVVEDVGGIKDPHWDNVVALLHFDGDLTDETGRPWTLGSASEINSSTPIFGSGSLETTGLGDGAYTSNPISDTSTPFTVETYVEIISLPPPQNGHGATDWMAFWSQNKNSSNGEYGLWVQGDLFILELRGSGGGSNGVTLPTPLVVGKRYHLAHTFDGITHRAFLDGVLLVSVNHSSGWPNTDQPFRIGQMYVPGYSRYHAGGYCLYDSFRITKGVARYTENFTPPTEPFPNK